MKYVQDDPVKRLEVRGDLFVRGSLRRGAHVQSGGTLFVDGSVHGDVQVDRGGRLIVRGTFDAKATDHGGLIAVAGGVRTAIELLGGLLVAAGSSVQVEDREWMVTATGALVEPPERRVPWMLASAPVIVCAGAPGTFVPVSIDAGFGQLAELLSEPHEEVAA